MRAHVILHIMSALRTCEQLRELKTEDWGSEKLINHLSPCQVQTIIWGWLWKWQKYLFCRAPLNKKHLCIIYGSTVTWTCSLLLLLTVPSKSVHGNTDQHPLWGINTTYKNVVALSQYHATNSFFHYPDMTWSKSVTVYYKKLETLISANNLSNKDQ